MAKSGKRKRPGTDARVPPLESRTPQPSQRVKAEQAREADEALGARAADASKSVKKKHTGGR